MRKIVLYLFLLIGLRISAQSADIKVAQLVNSSNWLELNRIYPTVHDSIQSPLLREVVDAMIGYEFNRPKQAQNAIYTLLQEHQSELGNQSISFVILLGRTLKNEGKYEQGATVLGNVVDALKGQPQTDIVRGVMELNRELQAIKDLPPLKVLKPDADVVVNSDVQWTLPVLISGRTLSFKLDPAVSQTTMSRNVAEELGLRILPDTLLHEGKKVQLAFIDRLEIGDIMIKNLLVDIPMDNNAPLLIGRDLLRAMGETQLDFDNKAVCFPKVFTLMPSSGANITCDAIISINNDHHRIAINYKDMFVKELGSKATETKEKEYMLEGLTVTGSRHLVKSSIGQITYDIQNDEESKTKSLFEMMRKVPLVTIDAQDNVLVRGSSSFRFYRNGHPDPSLSGTVGKNVLKSIPASSVSKVEVITESGAKYDAEGSASIVNIVMRNQLSLKGAMATLSSTVNNRGSNQNTAYVAANLGKLILSGTYSFSHYTPAERCSSIRSETFYKTSQNLVKQEAYGQGHGDFHYLNLSASYDIDSLNLLSMSLVCGIMPFKNEGHSTLRRLDNLSNPLYTYSYSDNSDYNYRNLNTRIDYQHKFRKEDEILTFSYMLATARSKTNSQIDYFALQNMPVTYQGYDDDDKSNFQEHTVQLDYALPLNKSNKIETGVKYIYRINRNTTDILYDGETANVLSRFEHSMQIAAAYSVWTFSTRHFSLRPGLRYEYTYIKGKYPDGSESTFYQYLKDWVPSLSTQWKFNDTDNIELSYTTSIGRPGITYLNPVVVSTPESKTFGNSHLKSSRSSQILLSYTRVLPKLFNQLVGAYGYANNFLTNIQYVENGLQMFTYANAAKYRMGGLIDYFQWMPSPKTTLSLNASLQWLDMKNPSMSVCNVGWYGNIGGNLSQKLWWKMRMNFGFSTTFGHSVSLYGVGANYHSDYLSLQRSFLGEQLTVALFASCPFEKHRSQTTRTVRGDYTGFTHTVNDARQYGITLTWQLGKMKEQVKRAEHGITNNDVIGGLSSGMQPEKLGK